MVISRHRLVAAVGLCAAVLAGAACGGDPTVAEVAADEILAAPEESTTTLPSTSTSTTSTTLATSTTAATSTTSTTAVTTTTTTSTTSTTTSTTLPATTTSSTTTTTTTTTLPPTTTTMPAPSVPVATACRSVALIGDSTFVGIDALLLERLAAVGVADVRLEIDGGRSVVERLGEQENGPEVAARVVADGFAGCWIVGLGTNDAANIAAGSAADAATRVQRMLDATGAGPILWLDASTIAPDTFWARPIILDWNQALAAAAAGSDRIALVSWDARAASQPWFVSDGIHPNAAGLVARADFVAEQLVAVFPAN